MSVIIGFLVGVIIALTGVGAGVVTAPLLIVFLHIPIEIAVCTALAYSAIVKLIVVPIQALRGQVNYQVLGFMLLGGIPGVILGSLLSMHTWSFVPGSALYFVLGTIILFTSGWHIFRHFWPAGITRPSQSRFRLIWAVMLPIGVEVGFSSAGAGALGAVALLGLTNMAASQVVGTDLAFGLVVALVGTGVHIIGGYYAGALLTRIAFGGILGAITGSYLAPDISNRYLRLALSIWLAIIGIQLCCKALTH